MRNYSPIIHDSRLVIKKFRCTNCNKLNQFEEIQESYTCIKCGCKLGLEKK